MIPDPDIARAFETTWPAAATADSGALRTGRGLGGGGRVGSTFATAPGWRPEDIAAAEEIHRGWDQRPLFRVGDDDTALAGALAARGYRREKPTAILAAGCADLAGDVPGMAAFAIWPPLAIQRELWAAGSIHPARQAVMDRVRLPRAALLGRISDRAAGVAFVAADGTVAMLHALEVAPQFRRRGVARWLIRKAALWAGEQGATRLALAVARDNAPAIAAYRQAGFHEIAGYAYWARD